jgi:gliding motility-associated-like protein
MNKILLLVFVIFINLISRAQSFYIINQGQVNDQINFYHTSAHLNFYTDQEGFYIQQQEKIQWPFTERPTASQVSSYKEEETTLQGQVLYFRHVGGDFSRLRYEEELPTYLNFFIGNDETKWRSQVKTYQRVVAEEVYEKIDVVYYFDRGRVRYDYLIKPGGNIEDIRIKIEGCGKEDIEVEDDKLKIYTKLGGEVILDELRLYQQEGDEKREVAGRWVYEEEGGDVYVKVAVEGYNKELALWIDPIIYSTYLGGSGDDIGYYVELNANNEMYVLGRSNSANFPTVAGSYDVTNNGNYDIVVSKFNNTGSTLLYSTYIGGSGGEVAEDMFLHPDGRLFITGGTISSNFPMVSALDNIYGISGTSGTNWFWGDAFVTVLNASGSALLYSSYLGGSCTDVGRSILVNNNMVYVCGATTDDDESNFPDATCGTNTEFNILLVAFDINFTSMPFVQILNGDSDGSSDESAMAMAIINNTLYLTGESESGGFNLLSTTYINASGTSPIEDVHIWGVDASTGADQFFNYVGSTGSDRSWDMIVNSQGNLVVSGYVGGTITGFAGVPQGSQDGGLFVFSPQLQLLGGRYLGGTLNDDLKSIKQNTQNEYVVTGVTESPGFPVVVSTCYENGQFSGQQDAFVSVISEDLSTIKYSRCVGGNNNDIGMYIQLEDDQTAVIVGYTNSSNFPVTSNAYDNSYNIGNDLLVTKLCLPDTILNNDIQTAQLVTIPASLQNLCNGQQVTIYVNIPNANNYTYSWNNGQTNDTIVVTISNQPQSYTVTITSVNDGCSACTNSLNIHIPQASGQSIQISPVNATFCINSNINLQQNVTGATGMGTPTGLPSGVNASFSNGVITISGVPTNAGTYNYSIPLTGGCNSSTNATGTITVAPLPNVGVNALPGTTVCAGTSVTLNGTGAASYAWSGGISDGVAFVPAGTQTYTVTGTDANGCSNTSSVTITVNPLPNVQVSNSGPVCEGENLQLVATGGSSYQWTGPNNYISTESSPIISSIQGNQSGVYQVTITDQNGCSNQGSTQVVIYVRPQVSITLDELSGCAPLCVNIEGAITNGVTNITNWHWTVNGEALLGMNTGSMIRCFETSGNYVIGLEVISSNNCSSGILESGVIEVYGIPEADFVIMPDGDIKIGDRITVRDESEGQIVSWVWEMGGEVISTSEQSFMHEFTDTGTYCITLKVESNEGCNSTVTKCIEVKDEYFIYIPNSFTPNEDQKNDVFRVYGRGISEIEMSIYNRWGEMIYYTNNTEGWSGKDVGTKTEYPMGVYVYKIKVLDKEDKLHEYIGHVNLLK